MTTYNVNELEGEALRLAVARAEGFRVDREDDEGSWCVWFPVGHRQYPCRSVTQHGWRPDVDWADGGPIIERERLELRADAGGGWNCMGNGTYGDGPTPLIAAMRAFVTSKFGETIDIDV